MVEQPIHNVVEVDEFTGRVTDIGVRVHKIRIWDVSDFIVPKSLLKPNKVNNWTFSVEWNLAQA